MSTESNEKVDIEKAPLDTDHTEHKGFHLDHIHGVAPDVKKVIAVNNAAFVAATTGKRLNFWTKDSLFLFWCVFVPFLGQCSIGYDGSLMTAINDMTFYQNKFNSGVVGKSTGIIFSMYTIGQLIGSWFAGPVADRWGRRAGMFTGCVFVCIGVAVIASSEKRGQFIGGRFILGFGTTFIANAAPAYCMEVAPPQWRGRMTGLYGIGWYGGSIPAAGICLGTQKIQSDLSWRLPLVFQAIPALVVAFAVFFLPESPRWLIARGRDDEAQAFLTKYHGAGDPNAPLVELEWQEIHDALRANGSDTRFWDYSELFNTKNARWRTLQIIMMALGGQFSGNGLGYFNTQIYAAVGYDKYMQFVLNLASSFVSAGGSALGVILTDRIPRRRVLIIGSAICGFWLGINGGLSHMWAHELGVKNLAVGKGAVAAYMFFNIVFGFTYSPLQAVYPSECLKTEARSKGLAMNAFFNGIVSFINLYAGPIALANITYNYAFVFTGWDCVESALWYFIGVDTNGRTIEELDEIFDAPYPPFYSTKLQKVAIKEDGDIAVVDE